MLLDCNSDFKIMMKNTENKFKFETIEFKVRKFCVKKKGSSVNIMKESIINNLSQMNMSELAIQN